MSKNKWIKVNNGWADVMPNKDCRIWVARCVYPRGMVQNMQYYAGHAIERDNVVAYQIARGHRIPEPYLEHTLFGRDIVCCHPGWTRQEERKKDILKCIYYTIIILCMALFLYSGLEYLCRHPETRHISYYGNDDYYMVNVSVNRGRFGESYSGALKKDEYEKWVNGDPGTIWIVSARNKNQGWRLNINTITKIKIYDDGWLPLNFK